MVYDVYIFGVLHDLEFGRISNSPIDLFWTGIPFKIEIGVPHSMYFNTAPQLSWLPDEFDML